jgi:hypothetical protein
MKLYGIELELTPTSPAETDTLIATLDEVHDSLVAIEAIYSVDIALDDSSAFLLVGIKVDDDGGADAAAEIGEAAISDALAVGPVEWQVASPAPAREMALASY